MNLPHFKEDVIAYFGYGSNINLKSLRAKGVKPISSTAGILKGWKLKFNVKHWFYHEGGMGNIEPGDDSDVVEGILHLISPVHLAALDAVESYGVGYDRVKVDVHTNDGHHSALTYVGLAEYIDNTCLPTQRYLNIIVSGAKQAQLSEAYIEQLQKHPIFPLPSYPPFAPPLTSHVQMLESELMQQDHLTALAGYIFDLRRSRPELRCLFPLFGGKDMTVFHLKRHDTSSGKETLKDFLTGKITEGQKKYINAYLHEYLKEFSFVGSLMYKPD